MLVWLASYPRSGNTLVRQVLETALGAPTYSIYRNESIVGLSERQYKPDGVYAEDPLFVKTHTLGLSAVDDANPALYIARDGRDALVSQSFFESRYGPHNEGRDPGDILRELVNGKGRWNWSTHVGVWHGRQSPCVTLRFEDLLGDPVGAVASACRTLGIAWTEDDVTLESFDSLHNANPDFYRSGKSGQWQDLFDDELHARFWEVHGHAMGRLGYTHAWCSYSHSQPAS